MSNVKKERSLWDMSTSAIIVYLILHIFAGGVICELQSAPYVGCFRKAPATPDFLDDLGASKVQTIDETTDLTEEVPKTGVPIPSLRAARDLLSSSYVTDRDLDLWYNPTVTDSFDNPMRCAATCRRASFRYAGVSYVSGVLTCVCGGSHGKYGIGECLKCKHYESYLCGSDATHSVYDTEFKVPSPPQQIILLERTRNAFRISWARPMSLNGQLQTYVIDAFPVFSYEHTRIPSRTWDISAESNQTYLVGLATATQYNVSIKAINQDGASKPMSALLWTKIGIPDTPSAPKIIWQNSHSMRISITSSKNTKGPVSAYRIALIDESQSAYFNKDHLLTWNNTASVGYPYYIAAEFSPENLPSNFVIGDKGTYNGFYNGPIPDRSAHWHPALGVVSTMDGVTESSYSITHHDQHSDAMYYSGNSNSRSGKGYSSGKHNVEIIFTEDDTLVTILWIAIGISGGILLLCMAAFLVLKTDLLSRKRRARDRSSYLQRTNGPGALENHQLSTRECPSAPSFPDISSETAYTHTGFVHDEDFQGLCVAKLKQVWYVPRNFLEIPTQDDDESVQLIANGKYGPVYLSRLKSNNSVVNLYSLPSSRIHSDLKNTSTLHEDSEKLYRDLDELVRLSKHENVVHLIGFMEDQEIMYFVTEFGGTSLKEFMLQVRNSGSSSPRSYPVTSYNLLMCAMNIAEGMYHLNTFKIVHGQLAACNVLVNGNIEQPKITGFGMLSCNPLKEERDYQRWSAQEVFQNRCVKPCDIWSFGILLWEIGSLGSTPYFDIRNEDLSKRICRGARPNQLEMMDDSLYQIMLHCWQIDKDERPNFPSLCCSIHELLPLSQEHLMISSSSNYPPYVHQYEHLSY